MDNAVAQGFAAPYRRITHCPDATAMPERVTV